MLLGDVNIRLSYSAKYDLRQVCEVFLFFFDFFSSNSILTLGETVSSYCPERTAHKKAAKKPVAIMAPIIINTMITDMVKVLS